MQESSGNYLRVFTIFCMGIFFWKIYKFPKIKTALTWGIWTSGVLIILSFFLKAFWSDGMIHASHAFFINGIVLLSLLIGTRVIVSHGPKTTGLENSKILYAVTFLLVFASATRVSAFLLPEQYLSHLAYSAILLVLAVLFWSWKYLLRPLA